MSDDDHSIRGRIGDAFDAIGDAIRGRDDDVDPDVRVHLDDSIRSADRVNEDER